MTYFVTMGKSETYKELKYRTYYQGAKVVPPGDTTVQYQQVPPGTRYRSTSSTDYGPVPYFLVLDEYFFLKKTTVPYPTRTVP